MILVNSDHEQLNPLECAGRGPDRENPDNININDVLGNFP